MAFIEPNKTMRVITGIYLFLLLVAMWLPGDSDGTTFFIFNVKLLMFWPIALHICYLLVRSYPFHKFPDENCALPFGMHQTIGSGALLRAGTSLFFALILFSLPLIPLALKDVDSREFGIDQMKRELEIMDQTIDDIRSGTENR